MHVLNSLTVSIGRNLNTGAGELAAGEWYLFRRQTRAAIERAGGYIVADTTGRGVYEGIQEESAVFIALNVNNVEQLKRDIAALLPVYKQDAAGFGLDLMPELVEARAMARV
jgi:hypothetical protein